MGVPSPRLPRARGRTEPQVRCPFVQTGSAVAHAFSCIPTAARLSPCTAAIPRPPTDAGDDHHRAVCGRRESKELPEFHRWLLLLLGPRGAALLLRLRRGRRRCCRPRRLDRRIRRPRCVRLDVRHPHESSECSKVLPTSLLLLLLHSSVRLFRPAWDTYIRRESWLGAGSHRPPSLPPRPGPLPPRPPGAAPPPRPPRPRRPLPDAAGSQDCVPPRASAASASPSSGVLPPRMPP